MINVIGIGQNRENMTLGAIKAIEDSDVIIGYKKYINQIEDLIEGKEILKKGMGDEIARAEVAIQKALSNLMQNKTVIAIAHRLSTLKNMDRIIVLDNGKIIEDDTPQNLLKKKNSTFKHFYSLQADGYLNFNTQKGDK